MSIDKSSILGTAVVASLFFAPTPADAHKPQWLDRTEWQVPNAEVSWALYGKFKTGAEVFTLRLSTTRPFAAPFVILVPKRAELENHRPAYAIVGPGLPPPSAEEALALPQPLPAGWGAFVEMNAEVKRPVEFESFLRRVFWTSGHIAIPLSQGDHQIWIWSPAKTSGKFVLAFGVEEEVGHSDYGDVIARWSDYAY